MGVFQCSVQAAVHKPCTGDLPSWGCPKERFQGRRDYEPCQERGLTIYPREKKGCLSGQKLIQGIRQEVYLWSSLEPRRAQSSKVIPGVIFKTFKTWCGMTNRVVCHMKITCAGAYQLTPALGQFQQRCEWVCSSQAVPCCLVSLCLKLMLRRQACLSSPAPIQDSALHLLLAGHSLEPPSKKGPGWSSVCPLDTSAI